MATENKDNSAQGNTSGEGMSMKERLLAQRRAAEAEGAKPSAPPVPAARPAAAKPAAAKPAAAASAPAPAAKPAPKPAASARSAAADESGDEPAPVKRAPKLAGAKSEERRERKQVSDEVRREVEMLRKRQDKWITYGWIVAAALLVIAGTTYFIVNGKKQAQIDAGVARFEAVKAFVDKFATLDPNKLADNEAGRKLVEDPTNDNLWKGVSVFQPVTKVSLDADSIVKAWYNRAKSKAEEIIRIRDLQQGLENLVNDANNASSKSAEELQKLRRRVNEYEGSGSDQGVEFLTKVASARVKVDRAYAQKLYDDAKAAAAKGPNEARAALVAYTKADDEITKMLDDASRGKSKNEELKAFLTEIFKSMITESDALVKQIFTPDVIEKTPWLDLMGADQKDKWQHPGFSGWQLKDGVIQGVGPDLGSKSEAIMSIGDLEQWRDYEYEIDFTVVKGDANFYWRVGAAVNNSVTNYSVSTVKGSPPFKAGQSYKMTGQMLASTFTLNFPDTEYSSVSEDLSWTRRRKGALAISVPPGSEVKISKMRLRVLR